MLSTLDRNKIREHLENFDLQSLFIEELGWDHGGSDTEVTIDKRSFFLKAVAHKRGMIAYQYVADSDASLPDRPIRQKIEKTVAKTVREHIIVYASHDKNAQYWQWINRELGQPDRSRLHIYHREQSGEPLIQKLEHLVFSLEEENNLTIVDVLGRVRTAFDVDKVTKKFYERFKKEHDTFLIFIVGIKALADREWYASLMMNRMMFCYFIQKQGFLNGDLNYLRNRLESMQNEHGKDRFQTFYRLFLLRLFHVGLSQSEVERAPELSKMLGKVPYLNGGLFDVHDLERENDISIPDEAFQRIFDFFDAYQWHLDDRPLHDDTQINPDVLGYIFEKYINQKQIGAYYTKEDITGYISRSTVIPFLFDQAKKECPIAFKPRGRVWCLLFDDPDRYFYESVRHGISYNIQGKCELEEKQELPPEIAAGLNDISKRGGWNELAPSNYALPTETWRAHVARRQRYDIVRSKLTDGQVTSINDLISYNLDIEKFAQDVISGSKEPELVRVFWKAINKVSILDPTCGSGAFLFAALNILEPIYTACLESMQGFIDDLERSNRDHHPETMSDFRKVLDRVADHASERYFILKSIIVGNLYGVDIMEEAVEICKLRLFLKLVAQLQNYDQIEPLPDIDFNISTGNTLVGFSSLDQVKRALGDDLLMRKSVLPDIKKRTEIVECAYRKFRDMQTDHSIDASACAVAKLELRELLNGLRDELDRYMAGEYNVKPNDKDNYEQWRDSYQPFHWFIEFHGIMHGGGFNVIIGNPPYVSVNKIPYKIIGHEEEEFPNIYGHVLSKALALAIHNGRCGMIIPLSITFSGDFKELRKKLCEWGSCWFSSFDNIPAALFADVRQRCTIWVGRNSDCEVFVSPLYRWRASYRSCLLPNLSYVPIRDLNVGKLGLPKLADLSQTAILRAISSSKQNKYRSVMPGNKGHQTHLGFSQTARNFISVFCEDPPCLDIGSLTRVVRSVQILTLADVSNTHAALAATAGELHFWYWLVRGDGFHVTSSVVRDYLEILDHLPPDHYDLLIELGRMLHTDRNRWLVFKKNAGLYVGNFNYRGAYKITRRADLLILDALSQSREEALAIFGYVQRVLNINEYAGEKGIPASVKYMFPVNQIETDKDKHLLSRIDAQLIKEFSFTERDLAFVINHDLS